MNGPGLRVGHGVHGSFAPVDGHMPVRARIPHRRVMTSMHDHGWRLRGDLSPTSHLWPNGSMKLPCRWVPQGI